MAIRKFNIPVTTNGSGAATVYSPPLSGYIENIEYVKTDFANGSTFTITANETGETIWGESSVNASTRRKPRAATHTTAGVAATYDGTRATLDRIALGRDKVKVVIASGGDTKTGLFVVTVDDAR